MSSLPHAVSWFRSSRASEKPDTVRQFIARDFTRRVIVPQWHGRPVERVDQSERHELISYKQS